MRPQWPFILCLVMHTVHACIWDARTLAEEKERRPDLATIILNPHTHQVDRALNADIRRWTANPNPDQVEWVNNLAGAYIRSGKLTNAIAILETAKGRFPNDYGVHANLGTAYHLLGRYTDAETEIARDLEINPDAHFGLEKYHLALLQYLTRDKEYQSRHLYVDEWTESFLERDPPWRSVQPIEGLLNPDENKRATNSIPINWFSDYPSNLFTAIKLSRTDPPLSYRFKWNLATDTNFSKGVMYMAELNPEQSAAIAMAGVLALSMGDYNLAQEAFKRAIALGSPQEEILKIKIAKLDDHIRNSLQNQVFQRHPGIIVVILAFLVAGLTALYFLARAIWHRIEF